MKRINIFIVVTLSLIGGSVIYMEYINNNYADEFNAMYYLWDKTKDFLFPVMMGFIYTCYERIKHYNSGVNFFIWAVALILFLRTQHGYYVDTGYDENIGTMFLVIDDALVVIPCFIYLYRYYRQFTNKLFE